MAMINGQYYTSFRAVNVKDGTMRIPDPYNKTTSVNNYAVTLQVAEAGLTADRTVYMGDGDGSMFLMGYDILYGTSSFLGNGNIAAEAIGQASFSITGLVTSAIVLVSAATSAQVKGFIPIGSKCISADKALVYYIATASAATTEVPINYVALFPQTS